MKLSYIFILHQTTTTIFNKLMLYWLSYIFILHQTTTGWRAAWCRCRCLISSFYIKPQRLRRYSWYYWVVLYLHSTSNHNIQSMTEQSRNVVLYLHSTSNHNNILYVPETPQLSYIFILHQTTTCRPLILTYKRLSYIFILHQTTTKSWSSGTTFTLSYIFILHQTTTHQK